MNPPSSPPPLPRLREYFSQVLQFSDKTVTDLELKNWLEVNNLIEVVTMGSMEKFLITSETFNNLLYHERTGKYMTET